MWYFLASLCGDSDANDKLRELEASVSPSEVREAQAQARRKYEEIRKRYGLD